MANLLDQASIILTPTAYDNGKVLCVKPSEAPYGDFDFSRATTATRINSSGLIETVANNIPRINYENGCGSWLFEPQSTNLIPYSSDFSNAAWGKQSAGVASAPIVTSNYSISPDGTLNADRVIFDINGGTTSSDFSQIAESVTSSIGDVTNSVWIKSNTASNYNMSYINALGGTTSIVVTNQWQRFDVTSTTVVTSSVFKLRLRGNESTSDSADVSIWGAQLEANYATSYIPTSGSQVTRNEDVCNGGGNASTFNDSEGVLMAEISFPASTTSSNLRIAISDTTANNRVLIQNVGAYANRLQFYVIVGGVESTNFNISINDITTLNKIVFKYKENDFSVWINGFKVLTDTSGITFPNGTLTELAFDGGDGGFDFYGKTKALAVWKTALTDLELEKLTSWTSFSSMAQSLNYTII